MDLYLPTWTIALQHIHYLLWLFEKVHRDSGHNMGSSKRDAMKNQHTRPTCLIVSCVPSAMLQGNIPTMTTHMQSHYIQRFHQQTSCSSNCVYIANSMLFCTASKHHIARIMDDNMYAHLKNDHANKQASKQTNKQTWMHHSSAKNEHQPCQLSAQTKTAKLWKRQGLPIATILVSPK